MRYNSPILINFCGSIPWDLSNPYIGSLAELGIKVWSALVIFPWIRKVYLTVIVGISPISDELVIRTVNLIQQRLTSDNIMLSSIAKMAVFSRRMKYWLSLSAWYDIIVCLRGLVVKGCSSLASCIKSRGARVRFSGVGVANQLSCPSFRDRYFGSNE
jgi:hypothetical protein